MKMATNAIQWSSAERVLVLPARLNIGDAAELHRMACAAFDDGAALELDASQVGEIDTAALQILVSLWIAAAAAGVSCRWRGTVPPPVRTAARLIGLHGHLKFNNEAKA